MTRPARPAITPASLRYLSHHPYSRVSNAGALTGWCMNSKSGDVSEGDRNHSACSWTVGIPGMPSPTMYMLVAPGDSKFRKTSRRSYSIANSYPIHRRIPRRPHHQRSGPGCHSYHNVVLAPLNDGSRLPSTAFVPESTTTISVEGTTYSQSTV